MKWAYVKWQKTNRWYLDKKFSLTRFPIKTCRKVKTIQWNIELRGQTRYHVSLVSIHALHFCTKTFFKLTYCQKSIFDSDFEASEAAFLLSQNSRSCWLKEVLSLQKQPTAKNLHHYYRWCTCVEMNKDLQGKASLSKQLFRLW